MRSGGFHGRHPAHRRRFSNRTHARTAGLPWPWMELARSRQRRGGAAVGQPRIHRPGSSGYHLEGTAPARCTPRHPRSTPVARHSHSSPRPFPRSGESTALAPGAGPRCSRQAVFSLRARPRRRTLAGRLLDRSRSRVHSIARDCGCRRQVTIGEQASHGTIAMAPPDPYLARVHPLDQLIQGTHPAAPSLGSLSAHLVAWTQKPASSSLQTYTR